MKLHPQKRQTNPFISIPFKNYIYEIKLAILVWVKKHVTTLLIKLFNKYIILHIPVNYI